MTLPWEKIKALIEEWAATAYLAGVKAGSQSASQPWQNIASAPRDGTSVILAVGSTRMVGYFSPQLQCWKQQGTGRHVLPSLWMVLPLVPKVERNENDDEC